MLTVLKPEDIKDNYRDLVAFIYDGDEYKRNTHVREYLNKLFCSKIKVAFVNMVDRTDTIEKMNKYGLSWDSQRIIFVNEKEEVVILHNSEWASFSYLKDF